MKVCCCKCGKPVGDADYEELCSMADDSVPSVWTSHSTDESTRMRFVFSEEFFNASWDAYHLLSGRAFDLCFSDDFRTNTSKLTAFAVLWHSMHHVLGFGEVY